MRLEMGSECVMVAVSKHSSSISALKWALSNKSVVDGGSIKLIHVRPPVRAIPTPMGNYVPVEQVSAGIVSAYMRDIQSKTEQFLQVHQRLCDMCKVQAEFVIVESDVVTTALLEQVSRLGVQKFIIGTSTCNAIMRKLKGPGIPEYVAKHAADFCTVLVVSKGRLVSVKEASCVSSCPSMFPIDHADGGTGPNNSILNEYRSCNFLGSQTGTLFVMSPNWSENSPMGRGEIRGFVSQPLPIQREKAASTINLSYGRSNSGPSQNHEKLVGPKGSQIFLSPFWTPKLPAQNQASLSCQETGSDDLRDDITARHRTLHSFQEDITIVPVSPLNSLESLEDNVSNRLNNIREDEESSQLAAEVMATTLTALETPVSANYFPFALNQGLSKASIDSQDMSAAVQINRLFQTLDEDRQMSEMLSNLGINVQSIASEEHNCNDQPAAETELEKLKFELEEARRRVRRAEEAAAMARRKAEESDAHAKKETKRREEALMAVQLARKAAAEEAKKYDEALTAMEAAKQVAEEEAYRRREAEDRAHQEAFRRQEAMAALLHAQQKYREYDYEDLSAATNCFSEDHQIGEGGYGAVYRGKLHHTTVAIKVLRPGGVQGPKEFQREVELLGRMHHPHMVLLLGACPEKACLVYEYLANGSLEDRLFCRGKTPPLPWYTRFRIAAEVATALLFLHASKPNPIVHRDLKPANILLDQNFVSKIGDVGLARLVPGIISYSVTEYRDTAPAGTFAYIDPEYQRTGVFCPRSDVYALGLVMLQLLTGKGAIGLTCIVENALEQNTLNEVLDPTAGDWPFHEATEIAHLALQCTELKRKNRPDLETCVLPKLETFRAVAEDYAAQAVWSKQSVTESGRVVPSFFLCPIFKEVMEDPHIAADGFTYEYGAIKQWLQDHNTSPMTNLKLSHKHLTPNHSLRSAILEWRHRLQSA